MKPMTRAEARRIRREAHRDQRLADFQARLGAWGVLLAWIEEARAVAKDAERSGRPGAVAELAQLLKSFCERHRP
ncbi:hypothetical protein AB8B12_22290 [Streptomyces sp. PGLac3x]